MGHFTIGDVNFERKDTSAGSIDGIYMMFKMLPILDIT